MRKRTVFIIALALLMALPGIASAIDLPKTGQTTTYATGDDGEIQAGVAWPSPRFTDNGDGTVTDNLTGLIWLKNANCFGVRTWTQALSDANSLADGSCGLTDGSAAGDWRLPNVNELESLINAEEASPATWLNGQGFSNVQSGVYWSSTTNAYSMTYAWFVGMAEGAAAGGEVGVYPKSTNYYVWPVRGTTTTPAELWETGQTTCYDTGGNVIACSGTGQDGEIQAGVAWPSPRFTDNLDGTVTDNLTGLIWLKNANCPNAKRDWATALSDVAQLNSSGTMNGNDCGDTSNGGSHQTDWRLPNRKELRSLIDHSQYNPALPSGHPFSNVQSLSGYWSSTTYANYTFYAWYFGMYSGSVIVGIKSFVIGYVWPVRAGTVGTFYNLDISKAGTGTGTVTSSPAGIDCGTDCTEAYSSGTQVTLTATPDTGSTFAGWSGDCSGTGNAIVTMDADKTCTATFTLNQYTITESASPSAGGSVSCSPNPVDHGLTSTCTITTNTGYTLQGVGGTCGGSLVGNTYTTNPITGDCTVQANFTLNQYTITESASPSAGGSVSCSPNPVDHGSTSTCTITTNTGYTLQGVGGTCGGSLAGNTYTTNPITGDCTVQANFTLNQYTITESASPSAGGSVSCSPNPVDHGSTSTCTITTNTGYTLQGVGGTCGGSLAGNTYTTNPITGDCTVQANFTLNQYTITESASPSAGGSVSCSPNPVDHGSTSTCTITTNTGYTLQGVGGTCGGSLVGNTYTTSAITGDCTVQANFTLNQYTITESASPSAGGSVSCSPNPVDHGSTSTCTITTNTGYTLQGVGGTCGGSLAGNTYTTNPITGDCTVVANFAIDQYTLTVDKSGTGSGTVTSNPAGINCGNDCSEPYDSGTTVTLTATSDANSTFAGWSGDCTDIGNNQAQVTMDANKTCTANFDLFNVSEIGVFRDGWWYLDYNGNNVWDGCVTDLCISFGLQTDTPIVGDWNGDGYDDIGIRRNGWWYLDGDGNGVWDGCSTDICAQFGIPSDIPVVGDFDGDGDDDIGVFRDGWWYLDINDNNAWDGCGVDWCENFGAAGDTPLVGRNCWDYGCSHDAIGVWRNGMWYLDENGNFQWDGSSTDGAYSFGLPTDRPVVGDWDGDGDGDIGIRRNGWWHLDGNGSKTWSGCSTDICAQFGIPSDVPVVGIY